MQSETKKQLYCSILSSDVFIIKSIYFKEVDFHLSSMLRKISYVSNTFEELKQTFIFEEKTTIVILQLLFNSYFKQRTGIHLPKKTCLAWHLVPSSHRK